MKHEKLSQALDHIDDEYIAQAAKPKKRGIAKWLAPIAAVLVVAIVAGIVLGRGSTPGSVIETGQLDPQYQIAAPVYPKLLRHDNADYGAYWDQQRSLHEHPDGYADGLHDYYSDFVTQLFTASGDDNVVCSPVNVYMALAMLAEVTDGQSRQQILDLLHADSIDALRTQAGHIWLGHYNDDGLCTSLLASSLWLQENYDYKEETVQTLADSYYASVFRGPLGEPEMDQQLRNWINQQTGDLLKEQAENLFFDPRTLLALTTTINYQAEWLDSFQEENNREAVFHSPSGDVQTEYMCQQMPYGPYFWGEHFGAVYLDTKEYGKMWLFLPDEGYTPAQISGEVMAFLASEPSTYDNPWENQKNIIVNLSLPKFDVSSDLELIDTLRKMGVTDIFEPGIADFSAILTQNDGGCLNKVQHAARLAVDEKGVTASAFTVMAYVGAGAPPEDEMDFILDRPFLFVMESRDLQPLFVGSVVYP